MALLSIGYEAEIGMKRPPLTTDPMVFPCGMSRSGTTLLTTILDSHSSISLGYELIPSPYLYQQASVEEVMDVLNRSNGDLSKCARELKKMGRKELGRFIKRYERAGLDAGDFSHYLVEMNRISFGQRLSLNERLYIAWRIAHQKMVKFSAVLYGFKFNMPSIKDAFANFPGGFFIYIIRDPRDVVDSHREHGFQKTTEQICSAWNNYIESYESFSKKKAGITKIIRYEDLVSRPRETIRDIFEMLPVDIEESVFRFYNSNASIHHSNHPNREELKTDFFTTSISRWRRGMSRKDAEKIYSHCSKHIERYGYA